MPSSIRRVVQFALAAVFALAAACASQPGAEGPLLGLQPVETPLPWFDAERRYPEYDGEIGGLRPDAAAAVTSLGRPPMDTPVSLRLSRFQYPAEDGHLDAIVRFDMELGQAPQGRLVLALVDAEGDAVSRDAVADIPGTQLFFSFRFPPDMAGGSGELRLRWERPGADAAEASAAFRIAPAASPQRSGRVLLTVPNEAGATIAAAPMTVGVPFPRGALDSADNLRLVDEQGGEIPLQVKETARWARFGGVKWVLCDFALDLDGGPREVFVEYGPEVSRTERAPLGVDLGHGRLPRLDAGRIRLGEDGLAFDATGDGAFRTVLAPDFLTGAFVEHAEGAQYAGWGHRWMPRTGLVFRMSPDADFSVEESGPEKAVLRAEGWFEHAESGRRFCKFVNRYVFHRDSPVVRVFHTWIFTGDGNRDRIRNMGWRFPVNGLAPTGFLSNFGEDGAWLEGYYLRQHDSGEFAVFEYDEPRRTARVWNEHWIPARPIKESAKGQRAAGVMAAQGAGVRLHVGVQDFWRNFPASLMLEDGALTFYQWPRYGRPAENPVRQDDQGNVWRLWFAHEGEVLSFHLPQAIYEGSIFITESGPEQHFGHGQPESTNAQGIAKTAEMWLYLSPEGEDPVQSARVLEGLHGETLRPVVDPDWMASSGAFGDIAAAVSGEGLRTEAERGYAENARSPLRHVERLGVYGKWIYGDVLREADLDERTGGLYRIFRKGHWGWPFSWAPFAHSGDTEFLRFAQAATRMMSDTGFCHYVGDEVAEQFARMPEHRVWMFSKPFRRVGWHNRNLLPWAGYWGPSTRSYADKCDFLWEAWYLTGYRRAKDVALAWAEQTKIEERDKMMRGPLTAGWNRGRWPANMHKQYTDMYQATFDPWFLAAAQAIADMNVWRFRENGYTGHFWSAGNLVWQMFSRCPEHMEFIRANFGVYADWHQVGWASTPTTTIPAAAFGYLLTGDEYYLRRAAGMADLMRWALFNGEEPWWYKGFYVPGSMNAHMLFTSWAQVWFPLVSGAFEAAGGAPERFIPFAFNHDVPAAARIAVRKEAGKPLNIRTQGRHAVVGPDGETYAEGEADEIVIGAEAPEGTYIVNVGRRRVRLPLTPPDTPEVLVPAGDGAVGIGRGLAQYWFRVPEGAESFWFEFENPRFWRQSVRQVVVWDADGNEAWAHRERAVDHDPQRRTVRAEVEVAPGQAGRIWRLTMPGAASLPFKMDPGLPGALSHDPWRWFDPAE